MKRRSDEPNAKPAKSAARPVVRVQFPTWERDFRPSDVCESGDCYFRTPGPFRRMAVILPGESWILEAINCGTGPV